MVPSVASLLAFVLCAASASAFTLPVCLPSANAPALSRLRSIMPMKLAPPPTTARSQRAHISMQVSTGRESDAKDGYRGVGELEASDYMAFGLAHCFTMTDATLSDFWVIEPLTGATLETLYQQIPTSYLRIMATTAGDVFEGPVDAPTGFKVSMFDALLDGKDANLCEDCLDRSLAAGRTMRRRVESQKLPVGEVMDKLNYQPMHYKRVLNAPKVVNDDDNVKQDISIDVYGRTEKPEPGNLGEMV